MNKKIIACLLSGIIFASATPFNASAEEKTHTVTVKNFDSTVIAEFTVPHGSKPDLSSIDTDKLGYHPDIYTQVEFFAWDNVPETVTENITIKALVRTMTISCDSAPTKTEYFSNTGDIKLDGLSITITDIRPEKDENGKYTMITEVTNIESKCTTSPANLDEAFAGGKKSADINIYPISSDKSILTYTITYFDGLGDVNGDNFVEATDASSILHYYASASVGNFSVFSEHQKKRGDTNRDGIIDASDASNVLAYYSILSTNQKKITWEEFFEQ